jgi:hypothetical protein
MFLLGLEAAPHWPVRAAEGGAQSSSYLRPSGGAVSNRCARPRYRDFGNAGSDLL